MERVNHMLDENRKKLQNLTDALLEHEVLEADEIQRAMAGELLSETRKSRSYLKKRGERHDAEAASAKANETAEAEKKAEEDAGKGQAVDTVA
jgi:cell division protease FtsH